MKRSQPRRDWGPARRKVENEEVCRVCGSNVDVQAAHIIGRERDKFDLDGKPRNVREYTVEEHRILPMCGDFAPLKCHPAYDAHQLDVLEHLTLDEQVQAVRDAGGIESARRRLAPSLYRILDGGLE